MITLKNKDTQEIIGTLTPAQLQFLMDRLEEESPEDHDYWLNRAELEILAEEGADAGLVELLSKAMGAGDEVEVEWDISA
ncbi:hypothetical protein [Thiofilum flexile]|uniref:hypothetical protein n=1 Tax=Thiofilum flexile TaxID=125627 RepID=UPI00037F820A|nr:hypothetical protein [Thiofilum flexile]